MKDYIVKNVQECLDSFEDIIKNAKHGFLRCAYEKPEYYNGRGIVISVIDTDDASVVYATDAEYDEKPVTFADALMKKGTLFKMNPLCVYVDGKVLIEDSSFGYAGGFIHYAFLQIAKDRLVNLRDLSVVISKKIKDSLVEGLFALYPTYDSIPDKYKNFDYNYKAKALNCILNDEKTEEFCFGLDDFNVPEEDNDVRPYCSYKTCIGYLNAVNKGEEEAFILKKMDRYLNYKVKQDDNVEVNFDLLIRKLGFFYRIREEARKLDGTLEEDDRIYIEIKDKVRAFLKDNDVNTLKVVIDGQDCMLNDYVKRKFPRFKIEGRDVVVRVIPSILMSRKHGEGYSGFRRCDVKYETPILREVYSTNIVRYLDVVYPRNVKSIRYNRTVIYERP